MTESDVYEKLREKISLWPIKVPRTREAMEMLKLLFTEEEARFLIHFKAPYQEAETLDQIVDVTGEQLEKTEEVVDRLVSKGLLFRFTSKSEGKVKYSLMPMIPGIFARGSRARRRDEIRSRAPSPVRLDSPVWE